MTARVKVAQDSLDVINKELKDLCNNSQILEKSLLDANAKVSELQAANKNLCNNNQIYKDRLSATEAEVSELKAANGSLEVKNKDLLAQVNDLTLHDRETLFFGPGEDSEENFKQLQESLDAATQSIDVCIYKITDDRISDILLKAVVDKGIKVRIIYDKESNERDQFSKIEALSEHIECRHTDIHVQDIRLYYIHHIGVTMHHKFTIIDEKKVLSGSYNYTRNASNWNYENITIENNKKDVMDFTKQFAKMWDQNLYNSNFNRTLKRLSPRRCSFQ